MNSGLSDDLFDLNHGDTLAMTPATFVTLTAFLLEDDDLIVLLGLEDGGLNGCAFYERISKFNRISFANHENVSNFNGISGIRIGKLIYLDHIVLLNCELSSLCFDCRFHGKESIKPKFIPFASNIRSEIKILQLGSGVCSGG